jgi:ABC-type Fe3+-hydroxamate transport system substrate-binding protein
LDFSTWSDLKKAITKIGKILGRTDESLKFSNDLEARLEHLINNEAAPWRGKSFAVIVQRQPLIIAAGETFVSSLLTHTGLKNVFEANRIAYPVLDEETFLRKSADIIFDMTHDADSGKAFFGKNVVQIYIEDYLAAPQSVTALEKLFRDWNDQHNFAKTP